MNTSRCGDCLQVWPDEQLEEIHNLTDRMEAGDTYPSGECPACGALCTPGTDMGLEGTPNLILAKVLRDLCTALTQIDQVMMASVEHEHEAKGAYERAVLLLGVLDAR